MSILSRLIYLFVVTLLFVAIGVSCQRNPMQYKDSPFLDLNSDDVSSFSKEDFMVLMEAYKRMNVTNVGGMVVIGCASADEINISHNLYHLLVKIINATKSVCVKSGPTAGARLACAFSHLDNCSYTEQQMNEYFTREYGTNDIPLSDVYSLLGLFCGFPSVMTDSFNGIDTMCINSDNCICLLIDDSSSVFVANFEYADSQGNLVYHDYYGNRYGISSVSALQSLYYYEP